jgi:hypothetical protein
VIEDVLGNLIARSNAQCELFDALIAETRALASGGVVVDPRYAYSAPGSQLLDACGLIPPARKFGFAPVDGLFRGASHGCVPTVEIIRTRAPAIMVDKGGAYVVGAINLGVGPILAASERRLVNRTHEARAWFADLAAISRAERIDNLLDPVLGSAWGLSVALICPHGDWVIHRDWSHHGEPQSMFGPYFSDEPIPYTFWALARSVLRSGVEPDLVECWQVAPGDDLQDGLRQVSLFGQPIDPADPFRSLRAARYALADGTVEGARHAACVKAISVQAAWGNAGRYDQATKDRPAPRPYWDWTGRLRTPATTKERKKAREVPGRWVFPAQDACVPDYVGLVIELLCELWRLEGSHPIATQIDAAILPVSRDGGSVHCPAARVGALRVLDEASARRLVARMDALSPDGRPLFKVVHGTEDLDCEAVSYGLNKYAIFGPDGSVRHCSEYGAGGVLADPAYGEGRG